MVYYNDNDPNNVAWLRELIKADVIAQGKVDGRSIRDVSAADLRGFTQCHFFAGIGGWSLALRLAGYSDDEPVWTGSCPCQPFSQAGNQRGFQDERHLWPEFARLIHGCKPPIIFGEQVVSPLGREWLAGVFADLEGMDYQRAAADLCAASVGAPMVSQRLHWVATTNSNRCETRIKTSPALGHGYSPDSKNWNFTSRLAETDDGYSHWWSGPLQVGWNCIEGEVTRSGRKRRAQWRIKPGLSLLADGVPGRVAQLCGFGNAIVPQLAAEFIKSSLEAIEMMRQERKKL